MFFLKFLCFCFSFCCSCQISSIKEAPVPLNTRHQKFYEGQKIYEHKGPIFYEPRSPKLLWAWGPKNYLSQRQVLWTQRQLFHEPKAPKLYETKAPKNLWLQKRYEPKGPNVLWTQDAKKIKSINLRAHFSATLQKCVNKRHQKEPKAPKILWTAGESRSIFWESF